MSDIKVAKGEDFSKKLTKGTAISPVDGRYRSKTKELANYFSEAGVQRGRFQVEKMYLEFLDSIDVLPFNLSEENKKTLDEKEENFSHEDFDLIKQIEYEGWDKEKIEATYHDVKAVEFLFHGLLPEDKHDYVHFGLTSEDTTNLAHSLLYKEAMDEVVYPTIEDVGNKVMELVDQYLDQPMMGYTHGQAATPTTLGKEYAVFLDRLANRYKKLKEEVDSVTGKVAGATGGMHCLNLAAPEVNWDEKLDEFVESLGLKTRMATTQVNPRDEFASSLQAIQRINNVLLDMSIDHWLYIHNAFLKKDPEKGATGSSIMPNKVNPINFENAEGNLQKSNSDLEFIADYLTTSRAQRDLSDSTVGRNVGVAIAHSLIGYKKSHKGLSIIAPNKEVIEETLKEHPETITAGIQTLGRRDPEVNNLYDKMKESTRESDEEVTLDSLIEVARQEGLSEEYIDRIENMKVRDFTGDSEEDAKRTLEKYKKEDVFSH